MKKIISLSKVFSIVLFISASHQVEAQSCVWVERAGGVDEDMGVSLTTDAAGNVYSLGNFYSQSISFGSTTLHNQPYNAFNYGAEMFLVKYDPCGNIKWAKQAGGSNETYGSAVTTDVAGNIYVTGYSYADTTFFGSLQLIGNGSSHSFIVKYDTSGNAVWGKLGNGNYGDKAYGITLDGAGNIYISGAFNSDILTLGGITLNNGYSGNDYDIYVAKLDNSGNGIWLKGGTGNYDEKAYGIGVDAMGNVYVTGWFESDYIRFDTDSSALSGYYDIFIVKFDANGNEKWLKTAGGYDADIAYGLVTDASGNSYMTGFYGSSSITFGTHTLNNSVYSFSSFVAKYDNAGNNLWAQSSIQDNYTYSYGQNIQLDANANAYVIGYYNSDSLKLGGTTLYNAMDTGSYDIFVAKYKPNGVVSWARSAGGGDDDLGNGIAVGPNNSLYISGEYKSTAINFNGTVLTSSTNTTTVYTRGDVFIANNIATSNLTPAICMVTTDSSSTNNIIYWDKTGYADVDSFIVYREVSSGTYKKIGAIPYDSLSQFIDTARYIGPANGNPMSGTYRYKIQTIDTAGNYGQMSPYHNSIFFIDHNNGAFTWNAYTVENATITPVSNFYLQRDDYNNGSWYSIGTVTGSQTTLNDPSYSSFSSTANYRIEAEGFNCNVSERLNGTNQTNAIRQKSHSNTSRMAANGIKTYVKGNIDIYPNPSSNGLFYINNMPISNSGIYIKITNILGSTVYENTQKASSGLYELNLGHLSNGTYLIETINNNQTSFSKIIISK